MTCRRQDAGIEPAAAREPAQSEEEDVEREQRQPEGRHRDPGERSDAQDVVGRLVRRIAATIPRATPTRIASTIASNASSAVAGIASRRSSRTGCCESCDLRRGRPGAGCRGRSGTGPAGARRCPSVRGRRRPPPGSADVTGPSAASAGSPGTSCVRTNAINVMPSARTTSGDETPPEKAEERPGRPLARAPWRGHGWASGFQPP